MNLKKLKKKYDDRVMKDSLDDAVSFFTRQV